MLAPRALGAAVASIHRASERDCLKILYWTQTKAYEAVKRSTEGPFMPFDGTKCPTETPSSYFLDSLSSPTASLSSLWSSVPVILPLPTLGGRVPRGPASPTARNAGTRSPTYRTLPASPARRNPFAPPTRCRRVRCGGRGRSAPLEVCARREARLSATLRR